ncbi:hypothetical protein CBL_06785 [Carabus blaptoides fortunei]
MVVLGSSRGCWGVRHTAVDKSCIINDIVHGACYHLLMLRKVNTRKRSILAFTSGFSTGAAVKQYPSPRILPLPRTKTMVHRGIDRPTSPPPVLLQATIEWGENTRQNVAPPITNETQLTTRDSVPTLQF